MRDVLMFALGVLTGGALAIAVLWFANKLFVIDDTPAAEVAAWESEETQQAAAAADPDPRLRRLINR